MSIYSFKNNFDALSNALDQYAVLTLPYSQQSTADKNRTNNLVSNMEIMTSAILEPANSWETSLQNAWDCVESNDIMHCHENLSEVRCSIINSIQNVSLQLSVIEDTIEEVENSLDIISQAFLSEPNSIDTTTYNGLKSSIQSIFDEMVNYKDFCQTVINDMQKIIDLLNLGTNPYNYEMYNSTTVLKMQILTSRSDIQTLRTDFFG